MPAASKKTNPLVWVLVGILGLFLVIGMVVIAGGIFVAKKVQDAASNPALAAAQLMAAANPDIEIVSSNESAGTITLREKSTGKTITVDFDQIKEGKLTFEGEGQTVTIGGSEEGLKIDNSDGSSVQIGATASAKLPEWLPAYPGATAQGTFAMQGSGENAATVSFTTKDAVERVAKHYEEALKAAGLTPSVNIMSQDGQTSGAMIAAESADKKRSAVVSIGTGEEGQTVGITYSDKK